jgi:penicillin-binding protein 1A
VVEGALLAIDNRTGQVRAMVGGFDFARSKFNRATQAKRQVGSGVQAVYLYDGNRSRLHAGFSFHRRTSLV